MQRDFRITYGDFSVGVLPDFETLRKLAPELGSSCASTDVFSSLAWFENLSAHGIDTANGTRLFLVRNHATGLSFSVPLLARDSGRAAAYGPTLESFSNYYSCLYGPIGEESNCSVEALRSMLRHLCKEKLPAGVINLHPLDVKSVFYANLVTALRAEKWLTDSYFCFGNWYLTVDGRSFEKYYQSVPSRIRNTIQRGHKKLDAAGQWGLCIHQEPGSALDSAIDDFESVYRQSWKVSEPYPAFVAELCRTAASAGWLRLGVVRLGDRPIAAQLWMTHRGRALIYKLAYDEEFKKYSAGSVLTAALMRHSIDVDRVTEIDYLTGDDGYKVDWMSHRRERFGVVAFNPLTLQGIVSATFHYMGKWSRHARAALVKYDARSQAQDTFKLSDRAEQ